MFSPSSSNSSANSSFDRIESPFSSDASDVLGEHLVEHLDETVSSVGSAVLIDEPVLESLDATVSSIRSEPAEPEVEEVVGALNVSGLIVKPTKDYTREPITDHTLDQEFIEVFIQDLTTDHTTDHTMDCTTEHTQEPTMESTTEHTQVPTQEAITDHTMDAPQEPTKKPTMELTQEFIQEFIQGVTTDPTQKPTLELTQEFIEEFIQEFTTESAQKPTLKLTHEFFEEFLDELTQEPTQEPTQESTQEPIQEPTQEPTDHTMETTMQSTQVPTQEPTDHTMESTLKLIQETKRLRQELILAQLRNCGWAAVMRARFQSALRNEQISIWKSEGFKRESFKALKADLFGSWKIVESHNTEQYLRQRKSTALNDIVFQVAVVHFVFSDCKRYVTEWHMVNQRIHYDRDHYFSEAMPTLTGGWITIIRGGNRLETIHHDGETRYTEVRYVKDGRLFIECRRFGVTCTRIYKRVRELKKERQMVELQRLLVIDAAKRISGLTTKLEEANGKIETLEQENKLLREAIDGKSGHHPPPNN